MWRVLTIGGMIAVSSVFIGVTVFSSEYTVDQTKQSLLGEIDTSQHLAMSAPAPLVNELVTLALDEEIENRFVGVLSHTRWLIENRGISTSDKEIIRINKQFESLADDFGDSIRDLRGDINDVSPSLTVDQNLAIGSFFISSDGDDEGLRVDSSGGVQLVNALLDAGGSAGSGGSVLQSTGTSTRWVATSTLGISGTLSNNSVTPNFIQTTGQSDELCLTYETTGSTWEWQTCGGGGIATSSIDTSAKLASILTDETGLPGSLVFSASPTFTGTTTQANGTYSGSVGVGVGTPYNNYKLTIENNTTSTNGYGFSSLVEGDPSSGGANYGGGDSYGTSASGNAQNITSLYGQYAGAEHYGVGTLALATGSYGEVLNGSTGTVTSGRAFGAEIFNNNAGGIITSVYGYAVDNIFNSGTITNTYGVFVGDVSVGTQTNTPYSFYASDANSFNYFAGAVGIGTSTPDRELVINGDVQVLGGLYDNSNLGGVTGQLLSSTGGGLSWVSTSTLGFASSSALSGYLPLSGGSLTGSLGIGTSTPDKDLTIEAASLAEIAIRSTATGNANIELGGNRLNDNNPLAQIIFTNQNDDIAQISGYRDGNDDAGALRFSTQQNGSSLLEKMRLDSFGQLGIGTTTPAAALQVFGDIRVGTTGTNGCLEDFSGTVISGSCSSDAELKTNISPVTSDESFIERLSGLDVVTYNWNQTANALYSKNTSVENLGLIAQNVEEVFPELVALDNEGYRQVDFRALPFYLIESVKEVWSAVTGNQERIETLEDRIEALEREVNGAEREERNSSSPVSDSEPTPDTSEDDETEEVDETEEAVDLEYSVDSEEVSPEEVIEPEEENEVVVEEIEEVEEITETAE